MITKFTGQDGCGQLISSIRKAFHTKKYSKTEISKLTYMEFFFKKNNNFTAKIISKFLGRLGG